MVAFMAYPLTLELTALVVEGPSKSVPNFTEILVIPVLNVAIFTVPRFSWVNENFLSTLRVVVSCM